MKNKKAQETQETEHMKVRITKTYSVSIETKARIHVMAVEEQKKIKKTVYDATILEKAVNLLWNTTHKTE